MKVSFLIVTLILYINLLSAQTVFPRPDSVPVEPPNAEAGSCYAKILIDDFFEYKRYEYPVYIGERPDTVSITEEDVVIRAATTRWIPIESNQSSNSAQTKSWKVVDVEPETLKIFIVDTTTTKDFEITYYETKKLVDKGGFEEWREIICEENIDKQFVQQLIGELKYDGYLPNEYESITMNDEIIEALKKLQRRYGLPVGALDFETLDELEIDY